MSEEREDWGGSKEAGKAVIKATKVCCPKCWSEQGRL